MKQIDRWRPGVARIFASASNQTGGGMRLITKGDSTVSARMLMRAGVIGALIGGAAAIVWLAL